MMNAHNALGSFETFAPVLVRIALDCQQKLSGQMQIDAAKNKG
jgi:hypothetical protein